MKISRSWLEDYVRFDGLKGQEFAEVITTRVAEVDAYEVIAAPVDKAVVVELLKVEPHPTAYMLYYLVLRLLDSLMVSHFRIRQYTFIAPLPI